MSEPIGERGKGDRGEYEIRPDAVGGEAATGEPTRRLNYQTPARPDQVRPQPSAVGRFLLAWVCGVVAIGAPTAALGMTVGGEVGLFVGVVMHGIVFLLGLGCMFDERYRPAGIGLLLASIVLPTILMTACFGRLM